MKHKNRVILLISIFILFSLSGYCQTTSFEFNMATNNDEVINDAIDDGLGNYYLVGFTKNPYTPDIDSSNALLLKINQYGELIDSSVINMVDKSYSIIDIEYLKQDTFLLNGFTYDINNGINSKYGSSIFLSKMGGNLNIFKTSSIELVDTMDFGYSEPSITFDNEIILCGGLKNGLGNAPINAFLANFSIDLDSLNFKIFLDHPSFGASPKKLSDGDYLIAGFGMSSFFPRYMFFDSTFEFISENPITETDGHSPFGLKWDSDTSFFLCSQWINSPPNISMGLIYQKNINQLDDYLFNSWGVNDTFSLPAKFNGLDFNSKDSIFIGGTKNYFNNPFATGESWYFVLQTDSLLNIRWERFYGGDAYYVMNSILATKDGGCLLVGSKYDYNNTNELERDIYILKLNNEGLITSTGENQSNLMHEAIVFPNPGTNKFNIRVAAQHPESTVELYNINGELILKNEIIGKRATIETSALENGTYIYKIFNKNGLFETGKWIKN